MFPDGLRRLPAPVVVVMVLFRLLLDLDGVPLVVAEEVVAIAVLGMVLVAAVSAARADGGAVD